MDYELNLRRELQNEGVARSDKRVVKKGRETSIDSGALKTLIAKNKTADEIHCE